MKLYTTTWDINTYSIKGTCKCSECGKPITKTFSFQVREGVSAKNENWDELERRRNEWLIESHVCNSCKKKKIKCDKHDISKLFETEFRELDLLQQSISDTKYSKKKIIEELNEKLKGKIIIYNKDEYVIRYVQDGIYEDCAFEISADKVSKIKPWLATDKTIFFYKRTYKECGWDNFIEIENCIITDEVFQERKQRLK